MHEPSLQPPKPLFFVNQRQPSTEEVRRDPFRTPDASVPGTPKSTASNPFSSPPSVISFSADQPLPGTGSAQPNNAAPILPRIPSSRVSTLSALRHSSHDEYDGVRETPRTSQIRASFMAPPAMSRRTTMFESSELIPRAAKRQRSTMLMGPIEKPWTQEKDIYVRISYWLTYAVAMIGVVGGALRCYFEWRNVPRIGNLCLVMQDDFDTFDTQNTWTQEVDMGGFGNGEFEMTTNSANNSFVRDGMLYIVPTLTSDVIGYGNVMNNHIYNVSGCTSTNLTSCGAVSNQTAGTVINPAMSARISTIKSHSITYGKVSIRAKLPTGDWLWPALWMLPVDNTYGPWPASGEIDIMESRGNGPSYGAQGVNYVRGSLNWGPFSWLNGVAKTYGWWTNRRKTFADDFHTYELEWTPKFIRIYVDSRLSFMLNLAFNEPFFKRGDFPTTVLNDSQYIVTPDPWVNGTTNVAPFDRPFYLIMNVAVGGTNGWFPDGVGDKPWLDASLTAMRDFAAAQSTWSATWPENIEDRALIVDSVKMWELC
ncbi:concanavalin A-like lectin/glucanase domain-containing protein [Amylocystis lapponica]|nr:concanavalin A-like lectin/glucanase domain-containing protein [Amylocystis lapponica]